MQTAINDACKSSEMVDGRLIDLKSDGNGSLQGDPFFKTAEYGYLAKNSKAKLSYDNKN